jgi:Cdc6-like AAA superfamily ATPase
MGSTQIESNPSMLTSSGLLYVCGHPGTGKTSTLKRLLANIEETRKKEWDNIIVFNYNGMAFKNLYQFCKTCILDCRKTLPIKKDS